MNNISTLMLFIIGLTAGIISAVFPRLMTLLVASNNDVMLTLFNTGFLVAAGLFALIVGVVMVWLYMGTTENTRNLFMAALAIPAVLSGGINMSSATSASQQKMSALSEQNKEQTRKLQSTYDIPDAPPLKLSLRGVSFDSSHAMAGMFQVSSAHAADNEPTEGNNLNPNISYQIKGQSTDYVILLESSKDHKEIEKNFEQLQKQKIPDVGMATSGDTFLIYQKQRKSKSEAVLDAIKLKEEFPKINPKIMKIE